MRISMTEEMLEIRRKIEPYRVVNGLSCELAPNTPDEIKELDKRFKELFEE